MLEAPSGAPDEIKTFFPIETDTRLSGLGPVVSYDSRDNRFSATKGFFIPLGADFYNGAFGADVDFAMLELAYNSYHALGSKRMILAFRAAAKYATSNVPYYMTPAIGSGPDLRGYAHGRYRDQLVMAAQSEFRYNFWWHLGAVAFVGIGTVASGFGAMFDGPALPSYGLGLRYFMHPKERLVVRIDYARGREDGQMYFSVGEAF